MNHKLIALALLLAATAVANAEMRTWNLKSGTTIEAEIVAFPSVDAVQVKRSDGQVYNLPVAYLADADRSYVATERAKQWKEVTVNKVLATVSGIYKKCEVSGQEVKGQILVTKLPAGVETALNNLQQQQAQITNLNSRIQADSSAARGANNNAAARRGTRGYRNPPRTQANAAAQDQAAAKNSLTKANADYTQAAAKAKTITTLLMKKTGLVYQGLAVWECQESTKRQ